MKPRLLPLLWSALIALPGCASLPVGEHGMNPLAWEGDQAHLKQRASYELKCPKEKLALTLLDSAGTPGLEIARQVGVDGCGHRLVYVSTPAGWVLDSSSGEAR